MSQNIAPAALRAIADLMDEAGKLQAETEAKRRRVEQELAKLAAVLGPHDPLPAGAEDAVTAEEYAASVGVKAETVRGMITDGRIGKDAITADGRIRPWVANTYAVTLSPNGAVAAKLRLKLGHKERLEKIAAERRPTAKTAAKPAAAAPDAPAENESDGEHDPVAVGLAVAHLKRTFGRAGVKVDFAGPEDGAPVLVHGVCISRSEAVDLAKKIYGDQMELIRQIADGDVQIADLLNGAAAQPVAA